MFIENKLLNQLDGGLCFSRKYRITPSEIFILYQLGHSKVWAFGQHYDSFKMYIALIRNSDGLMLLKHEKVAIGHALV